MIPNVFERKSGREHTAWQAAVFRGKAAVFQLRRAWQDGMDHALRRFPTGSGTLEKAILLAESRSNLWTPGNGHERQLQAGKVENLRRAVRAIDGVEIPGGSVFSFWKQTGRPSARRGFVVGRELREGCLIPSVGGGLCQLSNALYDCALKAGLEIVERHAHSQVVPNSLAEQGRDATVFWNYVDLRFRAKATLRIEAILDAGHLTVRFHGVAQEPVIPEMPATPALTSAVLPASCASCGMISCFRNLEREPVPGESVGVLVDDVWPEFDEWLQGLPPARRVLFLPLNGSRFGISRYAWSSRGYERVKQFPVFTVRRSLTSRKLARQGAARQRALLREDERLAREYARHLTFEITHLVITQSLLPFLWRAGVLGGRTFDVLLTRWPLLALQEKLDAAARLHPESPTLADFRADPSLGLAEQEALAAASKIITPHGMLAAQFCEKAVRVPWKIPTSPSQTSAGHQILFPASTLGRKGIYELREALRRMDGQLTIAGPVLESSDFWQGLQVSPAESDGLAQAAVVVLPAFVENQPRRLLRAIGRGIPVIATPECGLEGLPGVITVPAGDVEALAGALSRLLKDSCRSPAHI